MKIQIITLFPDMFKGVVNTGMLRKAQELKLVDFNIINLRDFGVGSRKNVDETPYGGGDGMVLRPEPVFAAVDYAKSLDKKARVILPTPRGQQFKQSEA